MEVKPNEVVGQSTKDGEVKRAAAAYMWMESLFTLSTFFFTGRVSWSSSMVREEGKVYECRFRDDPFASTNYGKS